MTDWRGEALIRAPKREASQAPRLSKSAKTAGRKCAVCGKAIYNGSTTGLCGEHCHDKALCGCRQCVRIRG